MFPLMFLLFFHFYHNPNLSLPSRQWPTQSPSSCTWSHAGFFPLCLHTPPSIPCHFNPKPQALQDFSERLHHQPENTRIISRVCLSHHQFLSANWLFTSTWTFPLSSGWSKGLCFLKSYLPGHPYPPAHWRFGECQSLCEIYSLYENYYIFTSLRSSPKPRPNCRSRKLKVMKLGRVLGPCSGEPVWHLSYAPGGRICCPRSTTGEQSSELAPRGVVPQGSAVCKTTFLCRFPFARGWLSSCCTGGLCRQSCVSIRSSSDADQQKTHIYTH